MKRYNDLIEDCLSEVEERFPWDLEPMLKSDQPPLLLDVREPYEFEAMHIEGALNVPRGILETACEWNFEETIPTLVQARERPIAVICRSGNRSVLAAFTMKLMGYSKAFSLKTGLRGWSDFELPLVDTEGKPVDQDDADEFFDSHVREDQLEPND